MRAVAVLVLFAVAAPSGSLCAALAGSAAAHTDVTPVQKVIQMLAGMLAKGKEEKHDEQVAFSKFQAWCDATRTETTNSIQLAAAKIEQLKADIAKAEADAEQLAEEITSLEASLAEMEKEVASATAIRDKQLAEYQAMHADFSESIDALERASQVLKAKEADVPQTLLQVQRSPFIPAKAKAVIASFLETGNGMTTGAGAPEANAYEFQSGGVVTMLYKLRLKFEDQRKVFQEEELNNKANYEMLMQKLTDDISFNKKDTAKKTALKAQRLEDAATAKGDLELTEKAKAEDEKTLEDTLAACHARSQEYEGNQVVRAGEVKAIEQAMEILQGGAVTGNADTYLPTFTQIRARSTALTQLRGDGGGPSETARQKAVAFLQDRAKRTGSQYLAVVAEHIQSDPFVKVKKMIKDLLVKLMEQANSEADGKAYCDTELGTNKMTRNDKQAEVEELTAHVELKTAESTQLSVEIAQLADQIAAIQASQAAATKQRGEEKAVNAKTVADAKVAQEAVEKATQILKEFYASAAGGGAFLQDGAGLARAMSKAAKAPYTGMQASSGGIAGMLEVILSDFARLEAETLHAEDQAQSAYEQFTAETNQDVAVKETEKTHNEDRRTQTENLITSLKKELDLTQGELDAAIAYYEKLKPGCVDLGLSYEERVKAREEELMSLKEALAILQQQDLA
jgi:hypothetical protein